MAAPHVAGAYAILKEQSPTAGVGDILSLLSSSGVQIVDPRNNIRKSRIRLNNIPWIARYTGPGNNNDAVASGTDPTGNVYVTGSSCDKECTRLEYATVKYSPTGTQLWEKRYGGGINSNAEDLKVDAWGNVYVTGEVCLSSITPGYCQQWQVATIKYDTDGNFSWLALSSGANWTENPHLGIDGGGNVYVTATQCIGVDCLNTSVQTNPFNATLTYTTVKYNNRDGALLWARDYSYRGLDQSAAISVDASGNAYVVGVTCGFIWYSFCGGEQSYTTVKYDPNGAQLWTASYANPAGDTASPFAAITVDSAENVIIAGSLASTYSTVKFDKNGQLLWVASYGPGTAFSVGVDTSNNVYVTGSGNGRADGTEGTYLTIKYDGSGNQLWASSYAGSFGIASRVALDNLGNTFVTGVLCQAVIPSQCNSWDYITVKYGPSGEQVWASAFNGGGANTPPGLAVYGGNVYVAATAWSPPIRDYVTIKYTP